MPAPSLHFTSVAITAYVIKVGQHISNPQKSAHLYIVDHAYLNETDVWDV